jgi:histidine triad (HIT) family protein
MVDDCIFCKMVNKEIPVDIIYENDNFFSILDAQQKIEGHSLVISKKHFKDTLSLSSDLGVDFLDCVKKTAEKVIKTEGSEGFNLVGNNGAVAGQVVMHVHYHILPRTKGDKVPHVY